MKVIFLGATAGCNLHVLLKLIESIGPNEANNHKAFVLARRPDEFRSILLDTHKLAPELLETNVFIVKGDATSPEDVRALFKQARGGAGSTTVDAIVSSVGGKLIFSSNPLKAPALSPPNICRDASKVLLEAVQAEWPASASAGTGDDAQPRIVNVTSNGIGAHAHKNVPFVLKWMYSWMLHEPHADKEEVETLLLRAANLPHPDFNPSPSSTTPATIQRLTLIRPALLTSAAASTKTVRAGETLTGAYSVSRADVGRVIWDECLVGGKWVGQGVTLAY
ncbi:unnamed protein product [Tilletia controversa]|nr:unnamed protein product [Tilletia controversa]